MKLKERVCGSYIGKQLASGPIRPPPPRAERDPSLTRSVHYAIGAGDRSYRRPACPTAELKTAGKVTNWSRARLGRARGRVGAAARARAPRHR